MKNTGYAIALIAVLFFASNGFGQITITFPSQRAVFQRDNDGKATVFIGGYADQCMERIEARFVPRVVGQGTAAPENKDWEIIQTSPQAGLFYGSMVVQGGWYRLEVRGFREGAYTSVSEVERVGVGEVFVVAGQSNATGGDGKPNGPSAADDRVNSINFQNLNPIRTYRELELPNPVYVKLEADVHTAPFGNYAWCWGAFGDSIVKNTNVPVMIFNAGWSGSGVSNWSTTIDTDASTVSRFSYRFATGLPFGHLKLALQNYVAQLGVRAILWHQGETENNDELTDAVARENYRNYLSNVINASRIVSGKDKLAWVVSRASWFRVNDVLRAYKPVVDAQNDLIGVNGTTNQMTDVFAGPETDLYTTTTYRGDDGIHFSGYGLRFLAELWAKRLTPALLKNLTPYPAKPPIEVSAAVSANSSYSFEGPAGLVNYRWLKEVDWNTVYQNSANKQWTASSGQYRLQATDSQGNVVLSPILQVPTFVIPTATGNELSLTTYGRTSFLDVSDQVTVENTDDVASILFPTFPAHTSRLEINNIIYGAGAVRWPAGGITVPFSGLSLRIDSDESSSSVSIPFAAINNFCIQSSQATLKVNLELINPPHVRLTRFEGTNLERQILLNWSTVQELTSDYFGIERSANGKSWREIGRTPAQFESETFGNYEFKDANPEKGINNYRLRMVDQDTSYAYSDSIGVRFDYEQSLAMLYPNPVADELYLNKSLIYGAQNLQVSDIHGRLVINRSLTSLVGDESKYRSIDVSSWIEGIYLVAVINQDGSRTQDRIIIKH